MATLEISREEIRKIVMEILQEELGIDRAKYFDILERLTRLEEGQKMILEIMNKRFEDFNRRFEDINKRFEDINSRFTMLTTFMAVGFSTIAALMVVLKIFY
ncbi:MAG: hypothetical protein WHS38_08070 [Thermodesulforhabdaceae bacterium]|jgi:hypothetical protein